MKRAARWIAFAACPVALALSLRAGAFEVPWSDAARWTWDALTGAADSADPAARVFLFIRLPRVLMAVMTGALLASSGCALQALFRNPLADPYLLGVSGGAALGAVAGTALRWGSPALASSVGALAAFAAVVALSRTHGGLRTPVMVLAGVAVHALCSAALTFLLARMSHRFDLPGVLFWLMGGLQPLPYSTLLPLMAASAVALAGLMALAPALNVMTQGDDAAHSLGLNAERLKIAVVTLAAGAIGLAVAFNGMIAFVGLVVPHAARLFVGADLRRSLPASAVFGATALAAADAVARTVVAPEELPVGAVTALIGAPFFLFLLRREGSRA